MSHTHTHTHTHSRFTCGGKMCLLEWATAQRVNSSVYKRCDLTAMSQQYPIHPCFTPSHLHTNANITYLTYQSAQCLFLICHQITLNVLICITSCVRVMSERELWSAGWFESVISHLILPCTWFSRGSISKSEDESTLWDLMRLIRWRPAFSFMYSQRSCIELHVRICTMMYIYIMEVWYLLHRSRALSLAYESHFYCLLWSFQSSGSTFVVFARN